MTADLIARERIRYLEGRVTQMEKEMQRMERDIARLLRDLYRREESAQNTFKTLED